MAKIVELICTEERVGLGTTSPDDPVRLCIQLWTKEGKLLVSYDPCDSSKNIIDSEIHLLSTTFSTNL